jgi:hypothetical protein
MVTRITIKETYKVAAGRGVHNLIDSGQAEGIFFACLVKICIINTHPPIFILFWYKNRIGEPICVVHFFYESDV